jgi:hypothetical protein
MLPVSEEDRMLPAESFLPSRHAFGFSNSWPAQPAVTVRTPFGPLKVGNANGGLCGGMVFAALDYWYAGQLPPGGQPAAGDPLYRYVVRRLIQSWRLPAGVAKYYRWMNLPDGDRAVRLLGRPVLTRRGLAWRTVAVQWPRVRAELDAGTPAPLGVVTVATANPAALRFNHQVLAYGYEVSGDTVTIRVYDPNRGGDDDTFLRFDTAEPTAPTTFAHNLGLQRPVRGFFRAGYRRSAPPGPLPQAG